MDVVKLFDDLESNNSERVDAVKRKFLEYFGSTKESWLIHNLMEYFGQTYSERIVEILVKVQPPHDRYIFDKLSEWLRSGSDKILALALFGYIIQKQPIWLYKVGNHQLVKDVLKLSKHEKEINPLINAVLCIINLLPVIPLVMGSFVQDLFDIFNYLATWDQNASHLPEYQLIHLQFGLYELFNRLYGMYPCNFVAFLKQEYALRGKQAVFHHTIKPLLDTVKIHPLLVSSDKDNETSQQRWKNMEPHDVVNECVRMSLEYHDRSSDAAVQGIGGGNECPCYTTPIKPLEYTSAALEWKTNVNFFNTLSIDQKLSTVAIQNSFWSPNNLMQPTPPPTSTVPHTPIPTPSYAIPTLPAPQLPAADGASPPEAAVEATPETTPMKSDIVKPVRNFPVNSHAARAIWTPSQPSSPIKKDAPHFNYETSIITSQKLLRMVSDRNQSIMQLSNSTTTTTTATSTNNSVPSSPLPIDQPLQLLHPLQLPTTVSGVIPAKQSITATLTTTSTSTSRNESPMAMPPHQYSGDLSQEDQEVNDINSQHLQQQQQQQQQQQLQQQQQQQQPQPLPSQSLPVHPMKDAFGEEDYEQEEGSPCSAGGLHFKNPQWLMHFTRHRYRMHSHCVVESDPCYSTGTSPADTSNFMKNGTAIVSDHPHHLRHHHHHRPEEQQRRRHSLPDLKNYSLKVGTKILVTKYPQQQQQQLVHVKHPNGGSSSSGNSSPSEEEAISAATHFHKKQERKTAAANQLARNYELFKEICSRIQVNKQQPPLHQLEGQQGREQQLQLLLQQHHQEPSMLQQQQSQQQRQQHQQHASQHQHYQRQPHSMSMATQTIVSWPQPYEQIFYGLLQEELRYKNSIAQVQERQPSLVSGQRKDPHVLLDQYIEMCVKNRATAIGGSAKAEEMHLDHIKLLHLQLQYERHRREIHAERNRRLLGKSRIIRALEQNNEALEDQVARLTKEISSLNAEMSVLRRKTNADMAEVSRECIQWKENHQQEIERNREQRLKIEALQLALADETHQRKEIQVQCEQSRGELYDLRNEMQQAQYKADLGRQYREELTRLQSEMILMGEIQMKCKEKLSELENLRVRDAEVALLRASYHEELKDLKSSLQQKSAQLDTAKVRQAELEQQLIRRDETITVQKRTLKTVKEEYQEKFKALERKYETQKAIILRMEDTIGELRLQSHAAKSPDSDKTDAVGSLDHTSPLSISLASSEGLSEIKNLALVVQNSASGAGQLNNNNNELDSNLSTPTTAGPNNNDQQQQQQQ